VVAIEVVSQVVNGALLSARGFKTLIRGRE
jgi:hypothetical protein